MGKLEKEKKSAQLKTSKIENENHFIKRINVFYIKDDFIMIFRALLL
jgi:hypothetical protein